jgi:hypothetical protein
MSKQRKSKPATQRQRLDADFLAKQMAAVCTMMWTVAERMEYFAGFNPKMKSRVRILAMHAAMLSMWSDEVREQAKREGDGDEQV